MSILSKHSNAEKITMRSKKAIALTLLSAFLLLAVATQAQNGSYSNLTLQPRSEATALRYSLFGTVTPVATGFAVRGGSGIQLIATGVLIGPSLGYFYGGCTVRGITGIGIRVGLVALTAVAADAAARSSSGGSSGSFLEGVGAVLGVALVGSCVITIHAIYDIAKVKSTVRKHNRQFQERSLSLVPTYFPDLDAAGLALQLTF